MARSRCTRRIGGSRRSWERAAGIAGFVLLLWMASAAAPGLAVSFTVNTTQDTADEFAGDGKCGEPTIPIATQGPADALVRGSTHPPADRGVISVPYICSLRAAIQELNAEGGGGHTIFLPPGLYVLTRSGIGEDAANTGDLDLLASITIQTSGGFQSGLQTVIDANGLDRVFDVHVGAEVFLKGLTIQGGFAPRGAGVRVAGTVGLADTTLRRNEATDAGGGLEILGEAEVSRSAVVRNHAGTGAGLEVSGGLLRMENSTISGNTGGAAIRFFGVPTPWLENVTLFSAAHPVIESVATTTIQLDHSILAGGCALGTTTTVDAGGNIESPGNTCGLVGANQSIVVADPGLETLAHYGGLTPTHALRPSSAARGKSRLTPCQATDQRLALRPGTGCDAGAFESDGDTSTVVGIYGDGFESGDVTAWSASVP